MKRLIFLFLFFLFFLTAAPTFSQNNVSENEYKRAVVTKIIEQGKREIAETTQPFQKLEVKITTGEDRGDIVTVEHGVQTTIKNYQLVRVGDEVVLTSVILKDGKEYMISDKYRLPSVGIILIGFFVLVVGLARLRGLGSIVGMIVSLAVLLKFIVPAIASGADPVIISLSGASIIVLASVFLAHGFYKRTIIAVLSTFITLLLAVFLSHIFVNLAHLTGAGSEEAYSLQFGLFSNVNLRGLLLGGMIIGTLGVLDDITTSLTASIEQLSLANSKLKAEDLFKRGLEIGKEHVTSLVNTLVLAYAGASMPLFLFFLVINETQPLWVTLNNEMIVEEIIRALVGSTALILAVPITTLAAALSFGKSTGRQT